jgi:MFS family permease
MQPHWAALAVLTTARTSLGFQFQSLASVSPNVVEELGLSYADLGTLIGLYFLPGVVMALPGGALGRRFGDKRVVASGLVLMLAGSVVANLAWDFAGLAAGRVLSGVGGVLLNVLMAKMVTDWFAGRREIVLAMAVFVNSFPLGAGRTAVEWEPGSKAAGEVHALWSFICGQVGLSETGLAHTLA